MFKIIIAGGRDFNDYPLLEKEVKRFIVEMAQGKKLNRFRDLVVISGKQKTIDANGNEYGADFLGEKFAKKNWIRIEDYPADWDKYGKAAGPIRNEEMAKNATHCIVFWDGKSRGTKNMIENAQKYKLVLKIIHY